MKKWIALCLGLLLVVGFVLSNYEVGISQNANGYALTFQVRTKLTVVGYAVIGDSLRVQGATQFNGSITSGTNAIAKIDSFVTTAVVDTTKMTGASLGDVFVVSQYTPAWSATLDTFCVYSARYFSGDSVIVKRAFSSSLPHVVKSAGAFCIVKIDK